MSIFITLKVGGWGFGGIHSQVCCREAVLKNVLKFRKKRQRWSLTEAI